MADPRDDPAPDSDPATGPDRERERDRDPDAAPDWLVVYGSLMRGLPAPSDGSGALDTGTGAGPPAPAFPVDLLDRLGVGARLRFAGPCRVAGELFDLGPYPALRPPSSAAASVCGQLHAILDTSALEVLDAFEGYDPRDPTGSDYLRVRVVLEAPRGIRAWIYVYNRPLDPARRVASGDWRRHLAERRNSPHVPGSALLTTSACELRTTDRRATLEDLEEEDGWDS